MVSSLLTKEIITSNNDSSSISVSFKSFPPGSGRGIPNRLGPPLGRISSFLSDRRSVRLDLKGRRRVFSVRPELPIV